MVSRFLHHRYLLSFPTEDFSPSSKSDISDRNQKISALGKPKYTQPWVCGMFKRSNGPVLIFFGFFWTFSNFYGLLWTFMDFGIFFRYFCLFKYFLIFLIFNIYYFWTFLDFFLEFLDFYGLLWTFMTFLDFFGLDSTNVHKEEKLLSNLRYSYMLYVMVPLLLLMQLAISHWFSSLVVTLQ
jgi:hypothetical protein